MANGIEGLKASNTLTAQVITVASGLLAFTVTFAEKFTPKGAQIELPLTLKTSWICFAVTMLFGFWTLMASTGTLNQIDRGGPETNPSRTNIRLPASLMFGSFFIGMCFLIATGWLSGTP